MSSQNIPPKGRMSAAQWTTYQRAQEHLNKGETEAALRLSSNHGGEPSMCNLHGVCLMRLGRFEPAVSLYRGLVVDPGAGWARPGTPTVYKVNFATAQFLAGRFQAGAELLTEAQDEHHPAVIRLRTCLRRWEKGLNWWQWINWRFGGSHPEGAQFPFDFLPGVLEGCAVTELLQSEPKVIPPVPELVNA
ncbi:MAG: hypothetical protein WDZ51_02075 [Pirellulaceae bacterium]